MSIAEPEQSRREFERLMRAEERHPSRSRWRGLQAAGPCFRLIMDKLMCALDAGSGMKKANDHPVGDYGQHEYAHEYFPTERYLVSAGSGMWTCDEPPALTPIESSDTLFRTVGVATAQCLHRLLSRTLGPTLQFVRAGVLARELAQGGVLLRAAAVLPPRLPTPSDLVQLRPWRR